MESTVQELDENEGTTAVDLDVQILFQKSNSLRSELLQLEKEKENFDVDKLKRFYKKREMIQKEIENFKETMRDTQKV